MIIHAFDLGDRTGYAMLLFSRSALATAKLSTWNLRNPRDRHRGELLARFRTAVKDTLRLEHWDQLPIYDRSLAVVWEHAVGRNPSYIAQHGELRGALMLSATDFQLDFDAVPVSRWKRLVVGKGNATKNEVREALLARPDLRGYVTDADSQDAIDAFCVGLAWAHEHLGWR
jgi:Holliday junction resolvasome RuvABC endonuclease subunit